MKYLVGQYETHVQYYEVDASNENEAVKKILEGEGDAVHMEYSCVNDNVRGYNLPDSIESVKYYG